MLNRLSLFTLLCVAVGLSYNFDYTQVDAKTEFLKRYSEVNLKTTSIQSEFIQEHHLEMMEEPIVSTGLFYYKKPNLMKWDQQEPSPYHLIVKGDEVVKFDGKKRKVLSAGNPQVAYFKNFIMGTVDGTLFESKQFESAFTKIDEHYKVLLTPTEKLLKKRIEKIELTFSENDLILQTLTIFELHGDKMILTFSNQEVNTISDNTLFN